MTKIQDVDDDDNDDEEGNDVNTFGDFWWQIQRHHIRQINVRKLVITDEPCVITNELFIHQLLSVSGSDGWKGKWFLSLFWYKDLNIS